MRVIFHRSKKPICKILQRGGGGGGKRVQKYLRGSKDSLFTRSDGWREAGSSFA
jgi:hypothetical protein